MAVRKFILTFGQSNGGTQASAADGGLSSWESLHAGIAIAAGVNSPNYTQGGYNDLFVMPGSFTSYPVVDLKAKAVRAIRYLTPYNPTASGAGIPMTAASFTTYKSYPGTARVLSGSTASAISSDRIWQYDPTGRTIVRESTGTSHTITLWGPDILVGGVPLGPTYANVFTVSPAFDPAPVVGEQFSYEMAAGVASGAGNENIVCLDVRFGYDWSGTGSWLGSLDGMKISCISGTAANLVGTTGSRIIKRVYLGARTNPATTAPIVEIELASAFPQPPAAGDKFTIAPADINGESVPFKKWAFFLPWSPLEGESTGNPAGTKNPFPPGFNFPNHHDKPMVYQPFAAATLMYGGAGQPASRRCAYHTGLANRIQEALGEDIYVVSLAIDSTSIAHNELTLITDAGVGWFDPRQQLSWAPGEANGCYQRLVDVLDSARLAAAAQGDTLQCIGIFFIQGEGDAEYEPWALKYQDNLTSLKAKVRQEIKNLGFWSGDASEIPWLQPKITSTPWTYSSTINAAITAVAAADEYMDTVTTDDLTKITGDTAHFNGLGLTGLETRLYEAWKPFYDGERKTALAAPTVSATPAHINELRRKIQDFYNARTGQILTSAQQAFTDTELGEIFDSAVAEATDGKSTAATVDSYQKSIAMLLARSDAMLQIAQDEARRIKWQTGNEVQDPSTVAPNLVKVAESLLKRYQQARDRKFKEEQVGITNRPTGGNLTFNDTVRTHYSRNFDNRTVRRNMPSDH